MKPLQLLFHSVQLIGLLLCCSFIVNTTCDRDNSNTASVIYNSSRSSSNSSSINSSHIVSSNKSYNIDGSYQPIGMQMINAG